MKDYLMREEAPLTEKQWEEIDELVVKIASNRLVGRRFIDIFGPLGGGYQSIELDKIEDDGKANLGDKGNETEDIIETKDRKYISISLIYKDFLYTWRDLELVKEMGRPLDYSVLGAAVSALSYKEDDIIFNGTKETEGIMNVKGRLVVEKGDWAVDDNPYKDVAKSIENLLNEGSYGPYSLVVSPSLYVKMQRIQDGTGVTVLSRVKELVDGRVYQTPVINNDKGVVVSMGRQNLDLVIGQDMVTAYLGDEQLNHIFRVMESVVLRIKRPKSICTIE
ncbi:family 1 encapsulin nanocompartment shell protein [Thermohalobacter berrensis]|uniref:family 1 encapsulin nanocompartment shell protein n=1 Tax=Thermohalobacter berrensis TaxID=99594 RepID=UPI0016001D60|nr:family 1 encapsulin nanocompartment shell protein [Thermohalobacter berrensis]